jgi:hypothetical protein
LMYLVIYWVCRPSVTSRWVTHGLSHRQNCCHSATERHFAAELNYYSICLFQFKLKIRTDYLQSWYSTELREIVINCTCVHLPRYINLYCIYFMLPN